MENKLFLDQIDADREAGKFIDSLAIDAYKKTPHVEITEHTHENSGRTCALWVDGKVIATTVVLRDDFNRSVVIFMTPNN